MAVRMLDVPNAQFSSVYSDVSEDDWFAGVVMQAMEQEIISRDEYFRPNDNVTREEMCKILMNILDLLGKADDATGVELNFADGTEISDWAVPYVKDAVKNGIIQSQKIGGEEKSSNPEISVYQQVGISYWTEEDGSRLAEHIKMAFDMPGGKERYWDQVPLVVYPDSYKVEIRPCEFDDIIEIDTFRELKIIDKTYGVV